MSTQDAIVAVIVAAIFANVLLAIGLIVGPRIRARRERREREHAAATREAAGSPPSLPRVLGSVRPVAVGPGSAAGSSSPSPSSSVPRFVSGEEHHEAIATDPVTGFELVPAWSKWLAEEGARIDRYGRPATIVLVELAGLDRLAERLGVDAADRLIPPIATTMRRHARASDNLARLGRARFGALLTETDEIRAINYVERVRSACDVWLESGAVALRLSIGWAEIDANQPVEVAVQAAERRLNEERQRNRARSDTEAGAEPDVQAAVMQPSQA
jgi:diguanylate cyclase (GGDEF)-like protein